VYEKWKNINNKRRAMKRLAKLHCFFTILHGCFLAITNKEEVVSIVIKNIAKPEVRGFLNFIAYCEGTMNKDEYYKSPGKYVIPIDEYKVCYMYNKANSLKCHPNKIYTNGNISSSASGRYQFLKSTWDDIYENLFLKENSALKNKKAKKEINRIFKNINNFYQGANKIYKKNSDLTSIAFGPFMQDAGAIYLLVERNVIADIEKGNYSRAIQILARTWASLPVNKRNKKSFYLGQWAKMNHEGAINKCRSMIMNEKRIKRIKV
jgi:muramidase (phage lysozyme)